jgi:hypothetical protein
VRPGNFRPSATVRSIQPEIGDRVRPARVRSDLCGIVTALERYGTMFELSRLGNIVEEYGHDVVLDAIEACGEKFGEVTLQTLRPFVEHHAYLAQRMDRLDALREGAARRRS